MPRRCGLPTHPSKLFARFLAIHDGLANWLRDTDNPLIRGR
jgi:hypothetical protein